MGVRVVLLRSILTNFICFVLLFTARSCYVIHSEVMFYEGGGGQIVWHYGFAGMIVPYSVFDHLPLYDFNIDIESYRKDNIWHICRCLCWRPSRYIVANIYSIKQPPPMWISKLIYPVWWVCVFLFALHHIDFFHVEISHIWNFILVFQNRLGRGHTQRRNLRIINS